MAKSRKPTTTTTTTKAGPTVAELQAQLDAAKAELQAAKAAKRRQIRLQVSQKGAISIYGIRRMPITMYVDEWATILGMADDIAAFGEENAGKLSRKG